MKKLLRIAGMLAALLVVALVVVYFFAGAIIRPIVESTAGKALGVPTTLGGVDLRAFAGNMTLADLSVSNPKPFEAPQFVGFKECSVTLEPSSLLGDTVKINEIKIDGLTLTMEQRGIESNIAAILKNLTAASSSSAGGPKPAASGNGGQKQLDIEHVIMTNTKLSVKAGGIPGLSAQGIDIVLPKLQIDRPMDPDGRLPKLADLMGQMLTQIAAEAARNPQLPKELQGIFGSAADLGKNFGQTAQNAIKGAMDNVVGKNLDNVGKNLGNLFGNKKDEKK